MPGRSQPARTTVLLVSEPSQEAITYADAMHRQGWLVDVSSPGLAVGRAAETRPRLVVLNEGHVSDTTFEVARRIRTEAALPAVVMTALKPPQISLRARAAGCACVSKPCSVQTMLLSMRSALALSMPARPRRAWLPPAKTQ